MSMNATFVQIDAVELARFQRDPSLVEALFQGETAMPDVFLKLSETMEDRVRSAGPQMLAEGLARLDPSMRALLAERLGKKPDEAVLGDDLLKLMQERPTLSLDKAWHGVHYVLCGEVEPGVTLLSQAVLGGTALGEDDEGFAGYGPARYFTPSQVAELAEALNRPDVEAESAARFDPKRMSDLGVYPGWQGSDADWVLDGFRSLRDFYSKAAAEGHAVVTCLV